MTCKTCDHFSGGVVATCRAPVPFWAEAHNGQRVYGEDGEGCAAHSDSTDIDAAYLAAVEENARLRHQINEASHPDFIWGALDNVYDAETTLDDYAAAVSRAIRAALGGGE